MLVCNAACIKLLDAVLYITAMVACHALFHIRMRYSIKPAQTYLNHTTR